MTLQKVRQFLTKLSISPIVKLAKSKLARDHDISMLATNKKTENNVILENLQNNCTESSKKEYKVFPDEQKDTSVPHITNFPKAQWKKTIHKSSISRQFSCLMKHINLRAYLLNKWYQNNYSFMQKTKEQENEINNISWAARILYDILAPSSVSIEYLCILAVLMSQRNDKKFLSSKMTLQNGQQIDLLMKDGIIIFKSKITNSMKKDCSRSIQQKDTSVPTILNFPNAQWQKTIQNSSELNKWYQNNYSFMQKTKEQKQHFMGCKNLI